MYWCLEYRAYDICSSMRQIFAECQQSVLPDQCFLEMCHFVRVRKEGTVCWLTTFWMLFCADCTNIVYLRTCAMLPANTTLQRSATLCTGLKKVYCLKPTFILYIVLLEGGKIWTQTVSINSRLQRKSFLYRA